MFKPYKIQHHVVYLKAKAGYIQIFLANLFYYT